MGKAVVVCDMEGWRGDATLYRLEPPYVEDGVSCAYVIVSAAFVPFSGPETYVFPATAISQYSGEPAAWSGLNPSRRGTLSKQSVLESMGYTVQTKEPEP